MAVTAPFPRGVLLVKSVGLHVYGTAATDHLENFAAGWKPTGRTHWPHPCFQTHQTQFYIRGPDPSSATCPFAAHLRGANRLLLNRPSIRGPQPSFAHQTLNPGRQPSFAHQTLNPGRQPSFAHQTLSPGSPTVFCSPDPQSGAPTVFCLPDPQSGAPTVFCSPDPQSGVPNHCSRFFLRYVLFAAITLGVLSVPPVVLWLDLWYWEWPQVGWSVGSSAVGALARRRGLCT
eukprot:363538-Chlamydomonas_euryale.AAC.5